MTELIHRTLQTGHARRSPRSEVGDDIVSALAPIIARGGGELPGRRRWRLMLPRDMPGVFIVASEDGPLVLCRLEAGVLEADLLPAIVTLREDALLALADCERCVAWTIIERDRSHAA